jgi:glycosyltransferase involved in cell wall biosynthesis
MPPRVSVIIPAYNAAEFIGEALDSVGAQTFRDFEVLVIDDGSTDGTADIAEAYGDPVRVMRTSNHGAARARNTGVAAATGELVAFLDADDIWEPDKLARQVVAIRAERRFVYCDTLSFGLQTMSGMRMSGGGTLPSGNILVDLVQNNFVATSTVLIDREVVQRAGGFDVDLRVGEDWMLWLRAARLTEASYVPAVLVRYRIHAGSMGSDLDARLEDTRVVVERGLAMLDLARAQKARLRRRAIAGCYHYAGMLAQASGDFRLARRYALAAVACRPSINHVKQLGKALLASTPLRRTRGDGTGVFAR